MNEQRSEARTTAAAKSLGSFDVFLSHNSRDKPIVQRIAEKLKRAGLEPWLDSWCLTPGGNWQMELAEGLRASAACAVFVGPSDLGDWEDQEVAVALDRAAKDPTFRIFLVLIPGLPEPFDPTGVSPFVSTRTWVDLRKGIDDGRGFQSLVNAIKGIPLGPEVPIEPREGLCPYRGLETFDEKDAEFFFGRDGDVQRLLEKLKAGRFLAVLGPSGSGKSSLVRAGLLPALRRGALPGSEDWTTRVLTPGSQPLAELAVRLVRLRPTDAMQPTVDRLSSDERTLDLAVSLAFANRPPAQRIVWVIDQLEEVFTLARKPARGQFLANLLYAASVPGGRTGVVLTMRADFYPRLAEYPELAQKVAANQFLVGAIGADGLRQVIEEPARRVGLELEHGLADTIAADIAKQPGALPLLEHALLEVWERRRGAMLTLEGYRESGGVAGALAKRAEAIFTCFTAAEQALARRVFLRLTQPGEGTEDTRRRASMAELASGTPDADRVESVVNALVAARLLTISTDQANRERRVDVAHEALVRGWPRLRQWIDQDRAGLRIHRRLTEAAEDWDRAERDNAMLYRGARLAEVTEWQERSEEPLYDLERSFLSASVRLRRRGLATRVGITVALLGAVIGASWGFGKPAVDSYLLRRDALEQSPTASFPEGRAWLGSGTRGERARRLVQLGAFSLDLHEATNDQYRLCIRAGRCSRPAIQADVPSFDLASDDLPVVLVNAIQAAEFCRWLGRRLPSEAEWERAARGSNRRPWPWGGREPSPEHANVQFEEFPPRGLVPVDDPSFAAGATREKVTHLVGNVREWTSTPAGCEPNQYECRRPWGGSTEVALVLRGKGWEEAPERITGGDAKATASTNFDGETGFRCARSDA